MRAALAALALAACGHPARSPSEPTVGCSPSTPSLCSAEDLRAAGAAPADAHAASEDEKLAAIQKAMNELDEAAQGCWAMAATERYDIEGQLEVLVDISPTGAKTQITSDTARDAKLASCVADLLARYRWAPPLYGQTIKLPFSFDAPGGQSVIDRNLVAWNGQGKLSVAVLLDAANTGNSAASMFELAIATGGTTGWRKAERAELWYFLGDARVSNPDTVKDPTRNVLAGEMMYVPAGGVRAVSAAGKDVHAVVVVVPGGREGSARAGALPTPEAAPSKSLPRIVPAMAAKTYGPATIFVEPATVKGAPLAASVLALPAGANVPEHVHAHETEMLYVLEGSGTMTIDGQAVAVTPTSVIQIPPNTKHAFTATAAVRALQVYTPPGPEQRFKKK
ncbi:MAG TPA: cupin domain-containing protein [Nannocystaceae bacterium]|nr:cupin domain-containing protein [Nannocystaceae bacterium]